MRFLFPHALFHFPSQSLGIDLIQSYLFLLQPSCHELTSMVDQADYNMSGHVALPTQRRIMTTKGEYRHFCLSMHFQALVTKYFQVQRSVPWFSFAKVQFTGGDLSLKQWLVAFLACEPFKKKQYLLATPSQLAATKFFFPFPDFSFEELFRGLKG